MQKWLKNKLENEEKKKTQVNNSRHINVVRNIPSRSTSGEAKGCIKVMLDEGHVGLNESQ